MCAAAARLLPWTRAPLQGTRSRINRQRRSPSPPPEPRAGQGAPHADNPPGLLDPSALAEPGIRFARGLRPRHVRPQRFSRSRRLTPPGTLGLFSPNALGLRLTSRVFIHRRSSAGPRPANRGNAGTLRTHPALAGACLLSKAASSLAVLLVHQPPRGAGRPGSGFRVSPRRQPAGEPRGPPDAYPPGLFPLGLSPPATRARVSG